MLIVGEKFANLLKKKETKIGIITELYFDTKFICKVKKEEFEPSPRVNSYMICMKRKKPAATERFLQSVLERDGKTKNAIMKELQNHGKTKNQARSIVKEMGLNKESLEKPASTLSGKFIERLKESVGGFL